MDIEIDIEYSNMEIPPRCRKPRPVLHRETICVTIPEVSGADAPEVMIIEKSQVRPLSVRHYKGEFFKEARLSYCHGEEYIEYEFSEIPWKRYLTPYYFSRYGPKEDVLEYIKAAADNFLIIDGAAYNKCGEPCYRIITFGFRGCGTGVFLDFARENGESSIYSALDISNCIKDAVRIAEMRGDKRCVPGILNYEHVKISVLRPEFCTLKSIPHKFD